MEIPYATGHYYHDHDHEIIDLLRKTTARSAAVSSNICTPSVASPGPGSQTAQLGRVLTSPGGSWFRLTDNSGLPEVLIADARYLMHFGETDKVRAGKAWRWIPPLEAPIILPCTARYLDGVTSEKARYSIGGNVTDEANSTDFLKWKVAFECYPAAIGPPPPAITPPDSMVWLAELENAFEAAAGSAESLVLRTPLFPIYLGSKASNETDRGAFALNSPENNTNVIVNIYPVAEGDADTRLGHTTTGEVDAKTEDSDVDMGVASWWYLQVTVETKNIDGFEQGSCPQYSNLEVSW